MENSLKNEFFTDQQLRNVLQNAGSSEESEKSEKSGPEPSGNVTLVNVFKLRSFLGLSNFIRQAGAWPTGVDLLESYEGRYFFLSKDCTVRELGRRGRYQDRRTIFTNESIIRSALLYDWTTHKWYPF